MKKVLILVIAMAAQFIEAQVVQVAGYTFQGLPATSCTPTSVDVAMQIGCINAQFVGTSSSISGNTIQVNVEYSIGIICLPAFTTPTHTVSMGLIPSGNYTVQINGVENGSVVSTINANLSVASCCSAQAGFSASGDTVCLGESVQFVSTATGAQTLNWFENNAAAGSADTLVRTFGQAGLYRVKMVVSDTVSGCTDSTSKTVFVKSLPAVQITGDMLVCPGVSATLYVQGGPFDQISWSNAGTDTFLIANQPGVYYVDVLLDGCAARDSFELSPYAVNPVDLGADTTICMGDTIILDLSSFPGTYRWQDNSTASTFLVYGPALYYVEVTDTNGCISTDSIQIQWANCGASLPEDRGDWQLYPNPTRDLLHIRSDIHRGWSVIELMDAKGAVMGRWAPSLVQGATALDLGSVPNGLYMLRIRTERITLHRRILIE